MIWRFEKELMDARRFFNRFVEVTDKDRIVRLPFF